jgi:3-hydroxyacyl-CoA dehydrogenase
MREDAILATNTSYLDPLDIGQGIVNAKRIVGLHFFSPAHIMKLMEIVRTPHTDGAVLASAFALAKRLRKVGVLCGICDGFIGNRMLTAYRRQADYLLADGALPAQIDQAMRAYGLPMGPYELQDLTGLQIAWANRKRQAATRNPAERYVDLGDQLCEQQRFGQRSGSGWYRYIEGSRSPQPDACVQQMIEAWSADHGITRQVFTDDDIQQRLLAVLANEGARIVEEGIAERELDVDMVKIHGYGFPRWRGGPMYAAEAMGNTAVRKVLEVVAAQSSGSWTIAGRYQAT